MCAVVGEKGFQGGDVVLEEDEGCFFPSLERSLGREVTPLFVEYVKDGGALGCAIERRGVQCFSCSSEDLGQAEETARLEGFAVGEAL